jgi:polyisoprenoid-binding protein YceI
MLALVFAALLHVDPARSSASFSVQHVFVERVTGTVPIASGEIELPAGSLIPARVSAVLDPTKIKTGEPDRDSAMQGPDWFDTAAFPQWTFTSTAIAPAPGGFTMDGLLTIHGVAQLEHLTVAIRGDAAHPIYHATCTVNRHAFGMKRVQLDPVIGESVDVTLDIATV